MEKSGVALNTESKKVSVIVFLVFVSLLLETSCAD